MASRRGLNTHNYVNGLAEQTPSIPDMGLQGLTRHSANRSQVSVAALCYTGTRCKATRYPARWVLLPYGVWQAADGREVLFNRRYIPLFERRPGGPVTAADPAEWVLFVRQAWFYNDGHTETERRERARAALRAWGLPTSYAALRGGQA